MQNKIAWIVPTRERPENIKRLASAYTELATAYSDLHIVLDGEHEKDHEYVRATRGHEVHLHSGPWRGLSGTLNEWGRRLAKDYKYIGFMGDDHLPRTPDFDFHLYHAAEEIGYGAIVYGPDLQTSKWPGGLSESLGRTVTPMTWWVIDSRLITLLNQMVPFVLSHTCVDDYTWQLGEQSGTLGYLDDVIVEHLHWSWDKAPVDDSYERSSAHHNRLADNEKWLLYQERQLPHDVRLVRAVRGTLK